MALTGALWGIRWSSSVSDPSRYCPRLLLRDLLGLIKAAMHRTYEGYPLQRYTVLQPIVIMVRENVSQRTGQANRKKPISVMLITLD